MDLEKLIVFVKAPRVGAVKTRLAKSIGDVRACDAYRTLAESVLKNVASLPNVELRFAPNDAATEITPWLRETWRARPQGEGDLGKRLGRAFDEAFADGAERVVIIGSDCPDLQVADVRAAWKELATHDLVVGPATDGGYWLMGLRASQPKLFENISWSSEHVLAETLQRAKALALRIQLLRILTDVDTETEWNAYVQNRKLSC
jgi:rSAM/selenodomain-associated transferase 1